jgi:ABC-2 type transport system permease protein
MPGGLQWFAENQPCTAFIETVRALLSGGDPGWYLGATLGWSVAIGAVGWISALRLYERRSVA